MGAVDSNNGPHPFLRDLHAHRDARLLEEQPAPGILLDEGGNTSPTLLGAVKGLAHNCLVHPLIGVVYAIGDFFRILSPRTEALGKKIIQVGEIIHDL